MENLSIRLGKTALLLALILSLFVSGFAGLAGKAHAADTSDIPKVIGRATPSVVAIIGKPAVPKGAEDGGRYDLAHGTGVIVKSDGVIVTNAHVVKDMNNIVVVTADGKSYPGRTTHLDEESDLALVKIEATGLQEAVFAAPNSIEVGETVMAIGTPISFALRNSVTVGIVSGIQRSVSSKYQLIQTDAAINPGNSGGALVNMRGEVVGINTMKYAEYGVDNLGFAIPVDTVQYVLKHFFAYGKVKRPYIGIELEESWEAVVGLPAKESLTISYVDPDSPAAKAGIKQGDVLLELGGKPVTTIVEYNEALKSFLPDQTVTLGLKVNGAVTAKQVTLAEDPAQPVWKPGTQGSSIDSDEGKTRIGDSTQGWSMKYPAGLIKTVQSEEGETVRFSDAKGEFAVSVTVEELAGDRISAAALLEKLESDLNFGATVLEKRYVEQAEQPYAKIVGMVAGEAYYQARAYVQDGKVFYVILYVQGGDTGVSGSKRNSFVELLDSFRPSFDKTDPSLKDITVAKKEHTVTNPYGLSFRLPAEWDIGEEQANIPYYVSPDYKLSVLVQVTSASSGDTLKAWLQRETDEFRDSYTEEYREIGDAEQLTIAGAPAYRVRLASTMGGKWTVNEMLLFIKDKYKYMLNIDYDKDDVEAEAQKLVQRIIDSAQIRKDDMDPSLGFIQDVDDLRDPNMLVSYTNKKYKFSVEVPETWTGPDKSRFGGKLDGKKANFGFLGGSLTIEASDKSDAAETFNKLESGHRKNADTDSDYSYETSESTVAGVSAQKISASYNKKEAPYHKTEYVFEKDGLTYTVTLDIDNAVRTERNLRQLDEVLASIRLQ